MNVLYLSYTGLMEPLGRSQVLAYLEHLASDHEITLITFERPGDLSDRARLEALHATCRKLGIDWRPQRYHHRPRLVATLWDFAVFLRAALAAARDGKADLVHARSYLPAFVALALKRLVGIAFIFDMRAFWPDEMVTAGRLRRGGPLWRLIKAGERACLRQAAVVVSLTKAAIAHLEADEDQAIRAARYVFIPTCVDLDRFRPARGHVDNFAVGERRRLIGTVGTVLSGWFQLDRLMAFLWAFGQRDPQAAFRIITRSDPEAVRRAAQAVGIDATRLSIAGVAPEEVAAEIAKLDAAAMFFEPAHSEIARCPTRMGEILACGRPVVANLAVGDVAEIIRRYRVGVVVTDDAAGSMDAPAAELRDLLEDKGLAQRCRQAAEEWFSLHRGVAAYAALYQEVTTGCAQAAFGAESGTRTKFMPLSRQDRVG